MKNLITLIFTLFIGGALQAQSLQLNINGNVAYTNGDPVPGIEVNINTDSLPSGNIYFVTAITDSDGDYSATIDLDDQDTQGQLYAYATNCDQTLLYGQGSWSPGNMEATIDFTYCDVINCSANIIADEAAGSLTAQGDGQAPLAYEWNTGETTPTIMIDPAVNFYTVSITDAQGCVATASYFYSGGVDTSCTVAILPTQEGTALETIASGTLPFSYEWSTGATTAVINGISDGTYCVTLTDATGCTASECITVTTAPSNYTVDGYVYLPDSNTDATLEGWVYLVQYDSLEETLTAVDTVPLQSLPGVAVAYYEFPPQPSSGSYLIKAALSPGSDGYDNHLPTYFGNVLWWDEANSINLPNNGWWWHDLTLIEGDNPGGPGFIGGYVADGANLLAGEIEVREDDPMAGVSIILLNEAEEPVAYTYTDEDGVFAFPGLDWGTYKVVIEHIGYEQKHYWVTLSPDNPSVDSLIFEVGSDSITDAEEVQPPSTVDLFPVPATDYLTVQTGQLQDVQAVEIWNAQGQRLLNLRPNTLESGTVQIDVSAFPAGVYWLRTQIGQQLATQKWIKQ